MTAAVTPDAAAERDLVARAFARPPLAGSTRVIAIDGRAGSGKTTLADRLAAELEAPVVRIEEMYGGWDGLERGIDLMADAVLEPIAEQGSALVPQYDWVVQRWSDPLEVRPSGLLIIEGVGVGARRVARFVSLLVWLELATDERKHRALARDGEIFRPHWDLWAEQEARMLAREQIAGRADIVFDAGSSRELP
jgi:cytidylate kinase